MTWDKRPTAFAQVVENGIGKKQKEIAADALQLIVTNSPVADGAYKSNHRVSINNADFSFNKSDISQQALALGNVGIDGAPVFCNLIIQNNAPYGTKLEGGSSDQAPAGVYGPAFELIRAKYSR